MNTMEETKSRLRLLMAGMQTIADNYGITSAQQSNFSVQMGELEDIIENVDIVPPAQPVTVADVTADISASLLVVRDAVGNDLDTFQTVISDLVEKVDALVELANVAGEPEETPA